MPSRFGNQWWLQMLWSWRNFEAKCSAFNWYYIGWTADSRILEPLNLFMGIKHSNCGEDFISRSFFFPRMALRVSYSSSKTGFLSLKIIKRQTDPYGKPMRSTKHIFLTNLPNISVWIQTFFRGWNYIFFVLFFCLLLHRLAVRISLPLYDFLQVIIVLITTGRPGTTQRFVAADLLIFFNILLPHGLPWFSLRKVPTFRDATFRETVRWRLKMSPYFLRLTLILRGKTSLKKLCRLVIDY